jgi:hypothetical protein
MCALCEARRKIIFHPNLVTALCGFSSTFEPYIFALTPWERMYVWESGFDDDGQ